AAAGEQVHPHWIGWRVNREEGVRPERGYSYWGREGLALGFAQCAHRALVGKEVCRLGGEMIDERVQSHAKPIAELATNGALYGVSARVVLVWPRVCVRKRPSVVEATGEPIERLSRRARGDGEQQDETER